MTTYYLYILHSKSINRYYTGVSRDPETRLNYHNSFYKGWTLRGRPWIIAFTKEFASKSDAIQAEKYIKQQKSKVFIKGLITGERSLEL